MTDYGSRYADKRQKIIEWRLLKVYREAQKDLFKKADSHARKFLKKERELQKQVAAGLITEQDFKDWRMVQEFAGKQWDAKLRQMADALLNYNQRALDIIRGEQYTVFAENANYQAFCFEKDTKGGISFDIYDETTVEKLIREKPELLPPKVLKTGKDRAWNQGIISNCITQGILQGESIPDIAKRIARDTASKNDKSMIRYARTAMTAAQNSGRLETMHRAQDMGIKVRKTWIATLDDRTRDAHAELDGVTVDIDQSFVNEIGEIDYPGDPGADGDNVWNCRCTLGYEYPDYENMAEQENNLRYDQTYDEEIEDMDYEEWAEWRKAQIRERFKDANSEKERSFGALDSKAVHPDNENVSKPTNYVAPVFADEEKYFELVGIERIKGEHSIEDDAKACNPFYVPGTFQTSTNCQRCVNAYVARRRGYEVRAQRRYYEDDRYARGSGYKLVYNTNEHEERLFKSIFEKDLTQAEVRRRFENVMLNGIKPDGTKLDSVPPDGTIMILGGYWADADAIGLSVGHVFIAEKRSGEIVYVDPQDSEKDASTYFDLMTPKGMSYFRADDKEFNKDILEVVEKNDIY